MELEVNKSFTFTISDEEASKIAADLFNQKMGYRVGLSTPGVELLQWLGSRNEDVPSGS